MLTCVDALAADAGSSAVVDNADSSRKLEAYVSSRLVFNKFPSFRLPGDEVVICLDARDAWNVA